jgi:ABC-type transport system involved in multi-copper enzyme maturation permease subunit
LPFLIGCAVKGALSPATFFATLLFLLLTAAGYGVLGLLCSFFSRKTISATVMALTLTIAFCVGTPIIAALLPDFLRAASSDYTYQDPMVLWLNPFYAVTAVTAMNEEHGVGQLTLSDQDPAAAITWFYFLVTLAATAAGLFYMTSRYRRAARE